MTKLEMWKYLFGEKKYIYYAHRYYPNIYVFIWGDIYTERERKNESVCVYLFINLSPTQATKKKSKRRRKQVGRHQLQGWKVAFEHVKQ